MSVDYRPRAGPSSSHDVHERSPPHHARSDFARHPSNTQETHTSHRLSWFPMTIVVPALCAGCALTTGYSEQRTTETNERRCAPSQTETKLRAVSLEDVDHSQDEPLVRATRDRLPTSFSWRAIQTAQAIDVLPLINQLELAEELPEVDASRRISILSLRQEVLGRVLLSMIAISSTAAHISCEIERTYQVADRLKNSEQARIKQQTLLAVIIGAGAAVASGGFSLAATESIGEGIAGIVGGTIAGALGISALYQESEQYFEHPDNILREVWDEPDTARFIPPSVWEFLDRPMKEGPDRRTFREELVDGWRQEGRMGAEGSEEERKRIQLLFAGGGTYRSSDLVVRGQMLDMLRATILLMNREVEVLIREVMIQMALRKQSWKGPDNP